MDLGSFSISLSVKDIVASRDFYATLGFEAAGGDVEQKWLIMRNGDHVIGLFEGMFEKNMLTFNPGWDQHCNETAEFDDVRDIQKALKAAGFELLDQTDESGTGPGSLMVVDPDGNPILIDQHR
ncbi:MAG: VOC family protein [Pseudomonadota bacterium]